MDLRVGVPVREQSDSDGEEGEAGEQVGVPADVEVEEKDDGPPPGMR